MQQAGALRAAKLVCAKGVEKCIAWGHLLRSLHKEYSKKKII